MKKYIILLLAALTLSFTAAPLATMAQGETGTEIVQPPADNTSGAITEPPVVEDPGEITTPPEDDFVLPDVPITTDPNYYFSAFLIFVATIMMLVYAIKKLLKWEDRKAFLLTAGVAAIVTAIGYFLKLGVFITASWDTALAWYVGLLLGSMIGYDKVKKILELLGFITKK